MQAGEKKTVQGESWRTTPLQVAREVVSKGWSENLIIAKVNGVLWDLERVLEEDSKVQFLKWDDPEGKASSDRYLFLFESSK